MPVAGAVAECPHCGRGNAGGEFRNVCVGCLDAGHTGLPGAGCPSCAARPPGRDTPPVAAGPGETGPLDMTVETDAGARVVRVSFPHPVASFCLDPAAADRLCAEVGRRAARLRGAGA